MSDTIKRIIFRQKAKREHSPTRGGNSLHHRVAIYTTEIFSPHKPRIDRYPLCLFKELSQRHNSEAQFEARREEKLETLKLPELMKNLKV